MRLTMAEEKKTGNDSPTFIITQTEASESSPAATASKRSPYKKWAIIVISVIAVVAIVLTAILVGMYLFTEAQKDIIKFSYKRDQDTKEDVTSDPNTNIVQYHVNSQSYEMWVIDDFNKDIQVMKIHSDYGTNCYVAPLNRTTATDPSKVSAPSDPKTMDANATYSVSYRAANTPIPDSSFLSKTAKDACKGLSTYWVYPSCVDPADESGSPQRQKRRIKCSWCGCRYCVWFLCASLTWC